MITIPRLSALIRFFGPIFSPASRNDVLDDNELEIFPPFSSTKALISSLLYEEKTPEITKD